MNAKAIPSSSPESSLHQSSEIVENDDFSQAELDLAEALAEKRGFGIGDAKLKIKASRIVAAPSVKPAPLILESPKTPDGALFDFNDAGEILDPEADARKVISEMKAEAQMDRAERLIENGRTQVAANALLRAREEIRRRNA